MQTSSIWRKHFLTFCRNQYLVFRMNFRSVNVSIGPRHLFPWIKQHIQVDGKDTFAATRSLSPLSSTTDVRDITSGDLVVRVSRTSVYKASYEVETAERTYTLRKVSYWHWECACKKDVLTINRLGGSKCVLSRHGRQMAIMSLNSNLPFVEDKCSYVKVHSEKYLFLSIAAALILKGSAFNIDPLFLSNNKLSPIHSVELAR